MSSWDDFFHQGIDLTGIELPKVKTELQLGDTVKMAIGAVLIVVLLVAFKPFSRMRKRY